MKTRTAFPHVRPRWADLGLHCAAILATLAAVPSVAQAHANQNQASAPPRVFLVDGRALQQLRTRIAAGSITEPALAQLRAEADQALKLTPLSVTAKTATPPSGDKHDYMSLAPYWWPDPKSPTGLPYIRRDGERNPEINQVPNHRDFGRVISATYTLSLAYYLFQNETYASHAATLLRTWFLDPATRMNPNLNYAQAVRGHNEGRGTGLIETASLPRVVDAVGLLAGARSWSEADAAGMRDWFGKFLTWMLESSNGRDEANAKNNHGSYYDVQVVCLALATGRTDLARDVIERARNKRIAVQIEPDGRQPLELARTKSFGYSVFNLQALFTLARLGENLGVDLWNFKTSDGRSIRATLDYLLPFASGERKWPYQQITAMNASGLAPLLVIAARKYAHPPYEQLAGKLDPMVLRSTTVFLATLEAKD